MKQLPEDPLRQFWLESKKEAPQGFSDFIMQNLPQERPLPAWLKKPLLSAKALGLLLGLLIGLGFLLSRLGMGNATPGQPMYQQMQQWLNWGLGWLGSAAAIETFALVLAASVLLLGLDRLLKRLLLPQRS